MRVVNFATRLLLIFLLPAIQGNLFIWRLKEGGSFHLLSIQRPLGDDTLFS